MIFRKDKILILRLILIMKKNFLLKKELTNLDFIQQEVIIIVNH